MMVSAPEYWFPCYRNLGFLRQEYPHLTCELAKWIAEDFDESIALELGKVLISLYDR